MFRTVHKHWIDRRRRQRKRVLQEFRRQFETYGYSVSGISDSDLDAAVTDSGRWIEESMPLTAKRAYWILRRLSPDVTPLRRRKQSSINHAEQY